MKSGIKLFCFIVATIFFVRSTLYAQNPIVYDKYVEARTVTGSFHSIKVSGGIDVYLTAADEQGVAVSNYGEGKEIFTTIADSILVISNSKNNGWGKNNKSPKVYVAYTNLRFIEGSSASDIYLIDTLRATSLSISLSNASDFKGTVMLQELDINISNASDVFLQGVADKVTIKSSGASDVKAYGLTALYCTAKQSGASDIKIYVTKEVYLQTSGSSDFQLKGGATITKK